MEFIVGAIVGGLIWAIAIYLCLKGRYEKKIVESYNKGYENGIECEKRNIFDYIERLESRSSKGSET